MGKMDKNILCITKENLDHIETDILYIQKTGREFIGISKAKSFFTKRGPAETNDSIVQIIPYVIIMDESEKNILTYIRTTQGGEQRLHNKVSVGVGGHIDEDTCKFDYSAERAFYDDSKGECIDIMAEAYREILEETGLKPAEISSMKYLKIIYSEVDEVGKYHVGIGLLAKTKLSNLQNLESRPNDGEIIHSIVSLKDLFEMYKDPKTNFEQWSLDAVEHILKTCYR